MIFTFSKKNNTLNKKHIKECVKMTTPRNEYPRPQLVRDEWMNLNGQWEFEIDNSISGKDKEFYNRKKLNENIIVPFCPESELSGIGNKDFMYCVWYRKDITIPENWKGKNIILHFGAVDYKATLYVNGEEVGTHCGGYTSFSFDITRHLKDKDNYITLCAEDNVKSDKQPSGKQADNYYSNGCFYTRTTGIWQTVWMECVSQNYIQNIKIDTDINVPSVNISIKTPYNSSAYTVSAKAYFDGKLMGESETTVNSWGTFINIILNEKHLWEVGCGNLYDVVIELKKDDVVIDTVKSYFGLRSVALRDGAFVINDKKVFSRLVLDQGYYPDGIYTAPNDEALKNDIIYSMKLGFNGARLHEKVFEPRFLYWADKLGYIVWGEYGNWGYDHTTPENIYNYLPEWIESVERDYNHPSIIGWCPFNETWDRKGNRQFNETIGLVYDVTKKLDSSRPVIDTSGNYHVRTDIYDIHDYAQDMETFEKIFEEFDDRIIKDQIYRIRGKDRQYFKGEPFFVSEYGGIKWDATEGNDQRISWGYGDAPITEEEFIERYNNLTTYLLNNKNILGFCYTQLYDVEQERNGLMTYERKYKFDPEIFYKINTQKAAIEE